MQWQVRSKVCSLFYLSLALVLFGPIPFCGILWRRPNSSMRPGSVSSKDRVLQSVSPLRRLAGGPETRTGLFSTGRR